MPSAKSKAAKAATAARVAAYNATTAALDADIPMKAPGTIGIGKLMNITGIAPDFQGFNGSTPSNNVVGALAPANTPMPFKPTLPSMLNLNTSPNMKRALAVGAVMGTGRSGNPSDEENVQPIGPGIVPVSCNFGQKAEEKGVEAVGCVARPLSPILDKGVRAYEFERQKVKRAGELVKRKNAKAAKTGGGYVAHSGGIEGSGADGGKKSRIGADDMDVDVAEMVVGKRATKITSIDVPDNGRIEVSLSELVLRQKKPRKVKDDDFEIISPVRPVIVLDDLEAREMDMDEPWEHVERDPFDKVKSGEASYSYAAVVLGIAH